MRIWRFADPGDARFAWAIRRGTWAPSNATVCPECTATRQQRVQPLVLEWQAGSDLVGDFVWAGFDSDIAITSSVARALEGRFKGFELGPVRMVQDPKLSPPRGTRRRTRPRVWLPYEGPPLHDLWVTAWVDIDLDVSTVELVKSCATCGRKQYKIKGAEEWKSYWDADRRLRSRIPRLPGHGLYVRSERLSRADIFRIHEFPAWVFCTDAVRDLVLAEGFTNVDFLEMGETVDLRGAALERSQWSV